MPTVFQNIPALYHPYTIPIPSLYHPIPPYTTPYTTLYHPIYHPIPPYTTPYTTLYHPIPPHTTLYHPIPSLYHPHTIHIPSPYHPHTNLIFPYHSYTAYIERYIYIYISLSLSIYLNFISAEGSEKMRERNLRRLSWTYLHNGKHWQLKCKPPTWRTSWLWERNWLNISSASVILDVQFLFELLEFIEVGNCYAALSKKIVFSGVTTSYLCFKRLCRFIHSVVTSHEALAKL